MNQDIFVRPYNERSNRNHLKLMYITNNPTVAQIAEQTGVDRIWVDLETIGKELRQPNMNTVKSNHVISDVSVIRNSINNAELLVRVNPLHEKSQAEIDEVIERGADIVMLPMFYTADDAKRFVDLVDGRAKTMLLVETKEAESSISDIKLVEGVDEFHIGLNDLHLAHKLDFMFELLVDGTVDSLCKKMRGVVPYGFGGIARLDEGMLPARLIIAEHYRLGSRMAILSRSFYDSWISQDLDEIEAVFEHGVNEIREYENRLRFKDDEFYVKNHEMVCDIVHKIVARKKGMKI